MSDFWAKPSLCVIHRRGKSYALVQALLVRQAAGAETAALEAAIDAAVYRLFGVAAGEIAVVEGRGA